MRISLGALFIATAFLLSSPAVALAEGRGSEGKKRLTHLIQKDQAALAPALAEAAAANIKPESFAEAQDAGNEKLRRIFGISTQNYYGPEWRDARDADESFRFFARRQASGLASMRSVDTMNQGLAAKAPTLITIKRIEEYIDHLRADQLPAFAKELSAYFPPNRTPTIARLSRAYEIASHLSDTEGLTAFGQFMKQRSFQSFTFVGGDPFERRRQDWIRKFSDFFAEPKNLELWSEQEKEAKAVMAEVAQHLPRAAPVTSLIPAAQVSRSPLGVIDPTCKANASTSSVLDRGKFPGRSLLGGAGAVLLLLDFKGQCQVFAEALDGRDEKPNVDLYPSDYGSSKSGSSTLRSTPFADEAAGN